MKNSNNPSMDDELLETVAGGGTDIHKFYSAGTGKLIGEVKIIGGKYVIASGNIPEKYQYFLEKKPGGIVKLNGKIIKA